MRAWIYDIRYRRKNSSAIQLKLLKESTNHLLYNVTYWSSGDCSQNFNVPASTVCILWIHEINTIKTEIGVFLPWYQTPKITETYRPNQWLQSVILWSHYNIGTFYNTRSPDKPSTLSFRHPEVLVTIDKIIHLFCLWLPGRKQTRDYSFSFWIEPEFLWLTEPSVSRLC